MKKSELSLQPIEKMLWIPGQGPDMALLDELAAAFPKPTEPLGEPWFMGEKRNMFDDLNAHGIEGVTNGSLYGHLEELLSGMVCFPELTEWASWYGYLVPRIVASDRFSCDRDAFYRWDTMLISGLFTLSLYQPQMEVSRYQHQFAEVLGQWIMHPKFWEQGLYQLIEGEGIWSNDWGGYQISADISMSCFLAWRYLHPQGIGSWFDSVVTIKSIAWRAHLIIWLVSIWPIFEAGSADSNIIKREIFQWTFGMWSGSDNLFSSDFKKRHKSLIPQENIGPLREAIKRTFTSRRYFVWIDQFAAHPQWWPFMEPAMEKFQNKYLT